MVIEIERLSLKVLRADKVALQRLAASEGEALSVVLRRILREELKRHGLLDIQGRLIDPNPLPHFKEEKNFE